MEAVYELISVRMTANLCMADPDPAFHTQIQAKLHYQGGAGQKG